MKKLLVLLMVALLSLSLFACGESAEQVCKATVTDKDGNVVELSAQEIMNIESENEAKFDSLYKGADITFIGTVRSIETDFYYNGSSYPTDSIEFEEGFKVFLYGGYEEDLLKTLSVGDKLKVSSQIADCGLYVEVKGLSDTGGWTESTLKSTKIERVD